MYLILTASKDTYVTNRKLNVNDGRYSNIGKASSLDLFKLQSENKLANAQASLILNTIPAVDDSFYLTNNVGSQITYKFTDDESDEASNIKKIKRKNSIKLTIDETYKVINESLQTFEAVEKSNKKIILQQKQSGFLGEQNNVSNNDSISLTDFSIKEFSKILIKFNYDTIKEKFDIEQNKKFGAKLKLFDISTGQVKPKNFSISVYPLSKSFDEGIGRDIYSFGHAGWTNFVTSSRDENSLVFNKWSLSGLRSKGSNGDLNIDIITGSDNVTYSNQQKFVKGDEDLSIDITNFVSKSLSGELNNNGLVVEFHDDMDQNSNTYFVKRFGSRHLKNQFLSPRIDFYCDDSFTKPDNIIYTNNPTRIYLENKQGNFNRNLFFTGSHVLDATKDQLSASLAYRDFKTSAYATQSIDTNGLQISGSYYVDFNIDMFTDKLHGYLTASGDIEAGLQWHILVDESPKLNTLIKSSSIKISTGSCLPVTEKFIISDIRFNHNKKGSKNQNMFLVSFVDTIANLDAIKIPYRRKGENLGEVFYSVFDSNTNKELVPFETLVNGTKMSYDDGDYYFTLFNSSLFKDRQIKFKFYLKDYNNLIIENDKVFRF